MQNNDKKGGRRKKSRYFETHISKVLKQVSSHNGITSNAKQQLNSVLAYISENLASKAILLTQKAEKKTLSEKEVENVVSIVFPGELGNNAKTEGQKAISNFQKSKEKGKNRQNKANIIFPPSLSEKFLRKFGISSVMVTSLAPVYLASVIEYLCADILDVTSHPINMGKRVRITIRDLELGVRNDDELNQLFNTLNIELLGGGVVPYIHSSLLDKKGSSRRKRTRNVSIKDIRKFQKTSNCLVFSKFPFEKLVRSIVDEYKKDIKISKDVFIVLQYYIEQYIIDLLRDANQVTIHSKRVKLMPMDIAFIRSIKEKQYYNLEREEVLSLSSSQDDMIEILDGEVELDEEI